MKGHRQLLGPARSVKRNALEVTDRPSGDAAGAGQGNEEEEDVMDKLYHWVRQRSGDLTERQLGRTATEHAIMLLLLTIVAGVTAASANTIHSVLRAVA